MDYDSIEKSLILLGPFLALVMAAGQLVLRKRSLPNYLYALTFISIFIWSGVLGIGAVYPLHMHESGRVVLETVLRVSYSLTAVFLYFLMQSIFNPGFTIRGRMYLLFLPALLAVLVLPLSFIISGSVYFATGKVFEYGLYLFSVAVYVFILRQINILRRFSSDSGSRRALFKIIFFLSIAAILTIIPQLADTGFRDFYSVPVLTVLFYLVTMRYPEFFILLREEARKAHYAKSKIGRIDVKTVMEDIEKAMIGEKLFLKSDLTLKELALRAGVTHHQLSEILNVYYGRNFSDFINSYRIDEARRIFLTDKDVTAAGICYAVGFNSSSAFYRAFKKETGISPAKFRRDGRSAV